MQKLNKLHKTVVVNENHGEKNETNSMKTQIAVISAIIGSLIVGRGVWQYVYPPSANQLNRQRQTQIQTQRTNHLTQEQLQRHTRIQQYLQETRRQQERRLTQRLRQYNSR